MLFLALAVWLLLLGILAGAVSINAFGFLAPWAALSAVVGLALLFGRRQRLPAVLGAIFGIASAGSGVVLLSQSSADFYFGLAIVIGLSIGGAVACISRLRSGVKASPV